MALRAVLDETARCLGVESAMVFLLDGDTAELRSGGKHRLSQRRRRASLASFGRGRRWVRRPSRVAPSSWPTSRTPPRGARQLPPAILDEGIRGFCAVPLVAKGELTGVLAVATPGAARRLATTGWPSWKRSPARRPSRSTPVKSFEHLQRAHRELELAYDTTIEGWAGALELRDKETAHHTQRVAELTLELARAAGMSEAELVHVRRGALLHDIGKMAIPDAILLKQDKLTDDEVALMKQHPAYAYELLRPIAYLRPALDIPYCHHERWDGNGYPRGLKGEAIPFAARLFAVVDVWDAIRSQRSYRESWSDERAREHIQALAGTHLDPSAVALFLRVMDRKASTDPATSRGRAPSPA